jgi:hypothetical protein
MDVAALEIGSSDDWWRSPALELCHDKSNDELVHLVDYEVRHVRLDRRANFGYGCGDPTSGRWKLKDSLVAANGTEDLATRRRQRLPAEIDCQSFKKRA